MRIPQKYPYAYDEMYLYSNQELHRLLYRDFLENEKYDFFSLVNAYMQTSEIREKMDIGNWSALNKGDKQLLNSIDYSLCTPKSLEQDKVVDITMARWMADIYCLFQWKYNILSKKISNLLSAQELCSLFNPLHETSLDNACDKIANVYFREILKEKDKILDNYELCK